MIFFNSCNNPKAAAAGNNFGKMSGLYENKKNASLIYISPRVANSLVKASEHFSSPG